MNLLSGGKATVHISFYIVSIAQYTETNDIVTENVSNTLKLLKVKASSDDDIDTASNHCREALNGSLRIFNIHLTADKNVLKTIVGNHGIRTGLLWNGYRFTTSWLENTGKSV